jgi:hypothetical protein
MTADNPIVVHRLQLLNEMFDLRELCLLAVAVDTDVVDTHVLPRRQSYIRIRTRGIV